MVLKRKYVNHFKITAENVFNPKRTGCQICDGIMTGIHVQTKNGRILIFHEFLLGITS